MHKPILVPSSINTLSRISGLTNVYCYSLIDTIVLAQVPVDAQARNAHL